MIIFDYFVYIIYTFTKNKLGIEYDDALRGSVGMLAVYFTFLIIGIVAFIGIIADNPISRTLINMGPMLAVTLGVILFFLFRIRYYKTVKDLNKKIKDYDQYGSIKNMHRLIYFIFIAVPIFYFVVFRLYKNKW